MICIQLSPQEVCSCCPLYLLPSLIVSPALVALSPGSSKTLASNLVANDNKRLRIAYFDYCFIFIQLTASSQWQGLLNAYLMIWKFTPVSENIYTSEGSTSPELLVP